MPEYIEREAVIDLITRRYENPEICTQEINSIPAADVVPVVRCMSNISDTDVALLKAYAAHNMNRAQTSKAVYLHTNSIRYRFAVIRRETGLDPQCFYDLVKLLGIAEEKDG